MNASLLNSAHGFLRLSNGKTRRTGTNLSGPLQGISFVPGILLTAAGFLLAIAVNAFFPQIAPVAFDKYAVGPFSVDKNDAYRAALTALVLFYLGIGLRALPDETRRVRYISRVPFRFAIGAALALWDVLGTKLQALPQPFFPGPAGILEAFLMEPGYILKNMLYSLRLFTAGFVIGVLFGVSTGILIGWFAKAAYWISPVLNICGVIPAVAWMPFALTLFPTPFSAAAFLIIICSWFPVASMTALGIRSTPKVQFEAARTLGASPSWLVFHVAVPHAMPQIFTGITTANAFAFTTLVMAEMMGQPGGLGYYINQSKVWSAYYKVFASILVMAVLFSLIMKLIKLIENRVLRWQKGLVK